jgi:3-deoxy-D-manno-oct-2-ulosonic acid (Kdo) hydroxylase
MKGERAVMSWVTVDDYRSDGWIPNASGNRSQYYCTQLEKGEILYFSTEPFALLQEDIDFLVSLKPADSRLHKNISYRPEQDLLRGFADSANEARVRDIMRHYAAAVKNFVSVFLAPYAANVQMDYASFRPIEEAGRNLPLHKRNDLLHVDAFPSRPTHGGRILRVFTNVNPSRDRVWVVGERFPDLASRFAEVAGLKKFAGSRSLLRPWKRGLGALGLPVADHSPYDKFMLHFHDWLKENEAFQDTDRGKERMSFPPGSTWIVFTDGVPHSALSGQFAMEQTFIIPVESLVVPELSPIRVLEKMAGRSLH